MALTKPSIISRYFLSMLLMAILPMLVVGYLWLADAKRSYRDYSALWQQSRMQQYQTELTQQLANVRKDIDVSRAQAVELLRKSLRYRVEEALFLINTLGDPVSTPVLGLSEMLKVLGKFHLNQADSFYTVINSEATILLAQKQPHLEQRNLFSLYQGEDRRALRAAIAKVMEEGEVYLTIPGFAATGADNEIRLAFAQYHRGQNIIVISHSGLSAMENQLRTELLSRFQKIYNKGDGSIFIIDQQSRVLLQAASMGQVSDISVQGGRYSLEGFWLQVNKHLQQVGENFLEYQWLDSTGLEKKPVLSYVGSYVDWGWTIGVQRGLNDYYQDLNAQQQQHQEKIYQSIIFIVSVVGFFLVICFWVAYHFYRINSASFNRFIQFFKEAQHKAKFILGKDLPCREFAHLAEQANNMLMQRETYEQALKNSRRRFLMALRASNSYVWDLDLSSQQFSFGGHFLSMLGYQNESTNKLFSVMDLLNLCHPDDRLSLEQALLINVKQLADEGVEFRLKKADGDYRWFYTRGSFIDEKENAQAAGLTGLITDIHDGKLLELKLQKANVVVEEASYVREQFLSSMSHELHTPLNNILGNLQLLRRDSNLSQEQQRQLKMAEQAGYYLLRLINDVLELSKIDSAYTPLHIEECLLRGFVQNIYDKVAKKVQDKGLLFTVELDPQLPKTILFDGFKIKQVLLNLLSNAIKYTEQGEISLRVQVLKGSENASLLSFTVADTGIGISADKHKDIFVPFTQLEGANAIGTGLGLSICARLATSMGATLDLQSQLGEGSCFSLCLPLQAATTELLGQAQSLFMQDQKVRPVLAIAELNVVGLEHEQQQKLCWAAKMGDIEQLHLMFSHLEASGFADYDWFKYCKRLLSHFELDRLQHFLSKPFDNKDSNEVYV